MFQPQLQPNDQEFSISEYVDAFLDGFLPKFDEELSKVLVDAIQKDNSITWFFTQFRNVPIVQRFLSMMFLKVLSSEKGVEWMKKHYGELILWLRSETKNLNKTGL